MSKSKMIVRTKFIDRACHWTVVICFFLVALSGISFFLPDSAMADANLRYAADGAFCTRSSAY
jgi:cytochrome b subunit of formate dehydrogenase